MLKDGVAVTWLRDNNGGRHLPTSVIYLFERIKKGERYLSLFSQCDNNLELYCFSFCKLLLSNVYR